MGDGKKNSELQSASTQYSRRASTNRLFLDSQCYFQMAQFRPQLCFPKQGRGTFTIRTPLPAALAVFYSYGWAFPKRQSVTEGINTTLNLAVVLRNAKNRRGGNVRLSQSSNSIQVGCLFLVPCTSSTFLKRTRMRVFHSSLNADKQSVALC